MRIQTPGLKLIRFLDADTAESQWIFSQRFPATLRLLESTALAIFLSFFSSQKSLTELLAELVLDVGLIHAIWSEFDAGIDFDEWKITADDR